eukprot:gene986-biopygen9403
MLASGPQLWQFTFGRTSMQPTGVSTWDLVQWLHCGHHLLIAGCGLKGFGNIDVHRFHHNSGQFLMNSCHEEGVGDRNRAGIEAADRH